MNFITGRLLASADIIDIVLAIIQVSFIVSFVYFIKCVYFSKQKDIFTLVNGWYSVDWRSIKKSKKILKALDSLKLEHSNLWSIGFKIDYFSKIHYRSNYTLLSICKDLHVNNELDSKKKDDVKRIITASGILFNFKIPKALFIMDQETITIALKYTVLSEKLIINFNNFNIDIFEEASDVHTFNNILEAIPHCFTYIAKIGSDGTPPNIVHLFNVIQRDNVKFYNLLNKDITNLKRVLTICYLMNGLDIPNGYVYIDQNVYRYLTSYNVYSSHLQKQRNHLSVVKNT